MIFNFYPISCLRLFAGMVERSENWDWDEDGDSGHIFRVLPVVVAVGDMLAEDNDLSDIISSNWLESKVEVKVDEDILKGTESSSLFLSFCAGNSAVDKVMDDIADFSEKNTRPVLCESDLQSGELCSLDQLLGDFLNHPCGDFRIWDLLSDVEPNSFESGRGRLTERGWR